MVPAVHKTCYAPYRHAVQGGDEQDPARVLERGVGTALEFGLGQHAVIVAVLLVEL